MNKDGLEGIVADLQVRFDEQTKIKAEAENEQLRLQGEYRLTQRLIDTLESKTDEVKKKGKK